MKLKDNKTGQKALYDTDLNIEIKDGNTLIATFVCNHASNYSFSNKYNDDIYCGDVVELFLQTDRKDQYYEIEVAPNNAHFIAIITNDGKSFSGERLSDDFVESSSKFDGSIWRCVITIPLNKINYSKEKGIYFNAFRIDTDGGERDKHLFSLYPTLCGSFHKMDSFKML